MKPAALPSAVPTAMAVVLMAMAPAAALTPEAGPRNFAGVCAALDTVWERGEELISSPGDVEFAGYAEALTWLAFGHETRNTVKGDHVDPLYRAGELVAFAPVDPSDGTGDGLKAALQKFAKRYRCKIVE